MGDIAVGGHGAISDGEVVAGDVGVDDRVATGGVDATVVGDLDRRAVSSHVDFGGVGDVHLVVSDHRVVVALDIDVAVADHDVVVALERDVAAGSHAAVECDAAVLDSAADRDGTVGGDVDLLGLIADDGDAAGSGDGL
jgi:hypothetical protein